MPSKIPAAIDGLLTLCRNLQATTLAGVEVVDGPILSAASPTANQLRRLVIGYDANDMAAEGQQEWASMPRAGSARAEQITIHCVAESASGQTDMKTRRDDAFAIVAAVEGAIKTDPTLNGAVTWANFGQHLDVRQPQTTQGAVCSVFFGVFYYARFA